MSPAVAQHTGAARPCSFTGRCGYGCRDGGRCMMDEAKLLGPRRLRALAQIWADRDKVLRGEAQPELDGPTVRDVPAALPNRRPQNGPAAGAAASARAAGFTGSECRQCHSMAMVRTGTCETCQACASTSGGCS